MNEYLSREEQEELKHMWLYEGKFDSEIAEWFGISQSYVDCLVQRITVSESEYEEKEADFAELLIINGRSRILTRIINRCRKRLEVAYERRKMA